MFDTFPMLETGRRLRSMVLSGWVAKEDPKTATVQITLSDGRLSGFLPVLSFGGGGKKRHRVWAMPGVGAHVVGLFPDGDIARGVVLGSLQQDYEKEYAGMVLDLPCGSHLSADGKAISLTLGPGVTFSLTGEHGNFDVSKDAIKLSAKGSTITLSDKDISITAGGSTLKISDAGITLKGKKISLN